MAGRRRLELAEIVFASVAEATGVPDEHYASELEELWDDPHETAELQMLRKLLAGSQRERQPYQASVSLCSVTDNPVYLT